MDSELVSDSLPVQKGDDSESGRSPFCTYTEQFNDIFPYYLSIGMTYEQFWFGDPMLCKYYREAEEIRMERKNQELWLQGMYIYEALADVSPVLHAFAKKGTKPTPYSETPYPVTRKQRERIRIEKEKKRFDKGMQFMEALMSQTNKRFEEVK